MSVPMFRAVPRDRWDPSHRHARQTTRRTPGNVPYLVDNLWEYLRPENLPSRRHAVYASPTPELALANATGTGQRRDAFVVTRVVVQGEVRQVQLPCSDARHHPDVTTLPRAVLAALGNGWTDLPASAKAHAALLYTPGVTREELAAAAQRCDATMRALDCAEQRATLWADAQAHGRGTATVPGDGWAAHDGEFFFELVDDAFYTLEALHA